MDKIEMQENKCSGKSCDYYAHTDTLECSDGGGSCGRANFLEAEESGFHDHQLIEATKAIKEILQKISADPKGRELSLIHTNMGTLLAWVNHGGTISEDAVSSKNDDATIAAALKLKM